VTTLLMVQTPDDVLMGWDSQMTSSNETGTLPYPKVFINNGIIYGVTGLSRASDLLQFSELPTYDPAVPPRKWLVTEWVPAFRDIMAGDPSLFDEETGHIKDFGVMVVLAGQAFQFDVLLNPSQRVEGIYSAGSGGDYAMGSIYNAVVIDSLATRDTRWATLRTSMIEALEVAARIDPYSGGPFFAVYASDYLNGKGAELRWVLDWGFNTKGDTWTTRTPQMDTQSQSTQWTSYNATVASDETKTD